MTARPTTRRRLRRTYNTIEYDSMDVVHSLTTQPPEHCTAALHIPLPPLFLFGQQVGYACDGLGQLFRVSGARYTIYKNPSAMSEGIDTHRLVHELHLLCHEPVPLHKLFPLLQPRHSLAPSPKMPPKNCAAIANPSTHEIYSCRNISY